MRWDKPADEETLNRTIRALEKNGIEVIVAENKEEAKKRVLKIIPKGSNVMQASSVTLEQTGITKEIDDSGNYISLRKLWRTENDAEKRHELRKDAALAPFMVGSVHAVTEDGKVLIASNSGSQIPGYAMNAQTVIWVVGTQKIVKDLDDAFKRLNEYTLPLEDEHMRKLYNVGSYPSKILIVQRENQPGRIKLIFIKENIGF